MDVPIGEAERHAGRRLSWKGVQHNGEKGPGVPCCGVLPADLSVEDVEAKLLGVRSVEGAAELYMSLERLGDSSPASSPEEDGAPVLDLSERCSPSLTEMKDWQYLTNRVSQQVFQS